MAIQKYEFKDITPIIKEIFPPKPCTEFYCRFNQNSLNGYFNFSMGVATGNNFALKRLKNIVSGKSIDDDLDFSSQSKYLYYNVDKKEY